MTFDKISKYYDKSYSKNNQNTAIYFYYDSDSYVKLSHQDLYKSSEKILQILNENKVSENVNIGILIKTNLILPSLILGINRFGCSFQCLDFELGSQNLRFVNFDWLFYSSDENINLTNASFETLISFNLFGTRIQFLKTKNLTKESFKYEICYLITTSGTTGDAKLVYVSNDSIMSNVLHLRDIFSITEKDVFYLNTPTTFDPYIIEIFLFLISCATLVITSPKLNSQRRNLVPILFPQKQCKYPGITVLQITPSLFFSWSPKDISTYILNKKSSLRILAFGGEKFPSITHLNSFRQDCNQINIYNLYGITELSCWGFIHRIEGNEDEVPLGSPLNETKFQIIQDNLNSSEGELELGSEIRKCFIDDEIKLENLNVPVFRKTGDYVVVKDKKIYFVGRNNNIVKKFGHRVSLDEIENFAFDFIKKRVVCVYKESNQNINLIIEDPNRTEVQLTELQQNILKKISKAAVINKLIFVDQIPITKHGKIDRKTLTNFTDSHSIKSDSKIDVFINICKKYLNFQLFDSDLTFKDLGGTSILAIEIINEFESITKQTLSNVFLDQLLNENPFKEVCALINFENACFESNSNKKAKLSINPTDLTSLEKKSLKLSIKWKYDLKACIDATPVFYQSKNAVLIGSHSHIFACIDLWKGSNIFETVLPDRIEGNVYINSTTHFGFLGCYDGCIYCINLNNGSIFWNYITKSKVKATPVSCFNNKAIVVGSYDKNIHCIDQNDGKHIWIQSVEGSVTSDAIVRNDSIFISTIQGVCYRLRESDGSIMWRNQGSSPIFGSPCLLFNEIIWADVKGNVKCLSCTNGEEIWAFNVPGAIFSSIEVDLEKKSIYFGCHNKCCYCVSIDEKSFNLQKEIQLTSPIYSKPCVFNLGGKTMIQTASISGLLSIYHTETYEKISELQLPGEIFSSGIIINNNLIIGCRDDFLYCIDIAEIK